MVNLLALGPPEILGAALVLFVASAVRGFAGFGFSAVLVAGLSFFIDPAEAVPLAVGLEVLASLVQAASVWKDVVWGRLCVLVSSALVGNPVGVAVLISVNADSLRAVTFFTLAALAIGLLAAVGRRTPPATTTGGVEEEAPPPSSLAFFAAGVVAGVVNGATAMSGLVLVLAMTAMRVSPAEMRGTLVAYLFFSDLAVLGLLLGRGALDSAVYVWRIGFAIPVTVSGVIVGSRAFKGASVESFRRTTLVLLLAISIVGLGRLLLFSDAVSGLAVESLVAFAALLAVHAAWASLPAVAAAAATGGMRDEGYGTMDGGAEALLVEDEGGGSTGSGICGRFLHLYSPWEWMSTVIHSPQGSSEDDLRGDDTQGC